MIHRVAGQLVRLLAVAMFGAGVLTAPAHARDCTAAEKAAADLQLTLTPADEKEALRTVFPWGAPMGQRPTENERRLVQRDYVINYDDDLYGPVWSANVLGLKPLPGGRIDCFRADSRIPADVSATPSDYDEPIFDQGHMVPNGDMTFSESAIINTFMMSNMSPQFCQFNRGVWQILETFARHWGAGPEPLYVVNGAVFERDGDGVRDLDTAAVRMKSRNGRTRVAIPSMYFKVFARKRGDGGLDTLTVLLPHDQTDLDGAAAHAYLDSHVSNLPAVEALTGLRFFPEFDGPRTDLARLWSVEGLSFRSLVAGPCRRTAGAALVPPSPAIYRHPELSR